jgi:hypothetical protein
MELEFHQLELHNESLRKRSARRERQLLSSLAEVGQQMRVCPTWSTCENATAQRNPLI